MPRGTTRLGQVLLTTHFLLGTSKTRYLPFLRCHLQPPSVTLRRVSVISRSSSSEAPSRRPTTAAHIIPTQHLDPIPSTCGVARQAAVPKPGFNIKPHASPHHARPFTSPLARQDHRVSPISSSTIDLPTKIRTVSENGIATPDDSVFHAINSAPTPPPSPPTTGQATPRAR